MPLAKNSGWNRREFIKRTAIAGGFALGSGIVSAEPSGVAIVVDPDDNLAAAAPAQWATGELEKSLSERGISVRRLPQLESSSAEDLCIVASSAGRATTQKILRSTSVSIPTTPEALGLVPGKLAHRRVVLASGSDVRGLTYALLELADRIRYADTPLEALSLRKPVVEQPANAIRSINRSFESDVEDKPWYNDREFWPAYLSMLAAQRFNRFSLTFGLGYDFTRNVTDCYFHFAYPFLLAVPGYNVRALGLPDEERDHNLEMLRFISEATVARGMDFQLGLWTHGYQWTDSPHANYTISGLTPETHAAYCRDSLHAVLEACRAISSLAFRVHGESGVPEESYGFWKTVFDGVVRSGRRIEINLHAKGIDQRLIDVALQTGMPVTVSPKYWAEHMGLPYQQASIRELEKPREQKTNNFFSLSSGSRSFLRYGYGDLLAAGRRYGVYNRIWPGTQRVLLWGDPVTVAACARASSFCGELGVDVFEPLSFKGRRGSGIAGGRCSYKDSTLKPHYDFEKFLYTYRLWGRNLYNPDTDPEAWRRLLRKQFGAAAPAMEAALAQASRILPLVTTAHGPSAANNTYWPEIYTNMAIVDTGKKSIYGDTPTPKVFGNASSFDPELFSRVNDFAEEMLKDERSGKFSPVEVTQWLEEMADATVKHLAEAEAKASDRRSPEFRRMALDVAIQSGLGRFFAWKFRSGVLYAIFQQSGEPTALQEALTAHSRARTAWADVAERARGVYTSDITYGPEPNLRGHWLDRLAGIDEDIAEMEKQISGKTVETVTVPDRERAHQAIRETLERPVQRRNPWRHHPPPHFQPGEPLEIEIAIEKTKAASNNLLVHLRYRHVDQAEDYVVAEMKEQDRRYHAAIPGAYTQSPYPLQYFFELHEGPRDAWLLPGFDPNVPAQPYFVVGRK